MVFQDPLHDFRPKIKLIQTQMLKVGLLTAQLLSIPRNAVFQILQEPRAVPLLMFKGSTDVDIFALF